MFEDQPFIDDLYHRLDAVDNQGGDPFDVETISTVLAEQTSEWTAMLNRAADIDEAWDEFSVTSEENHIAVEVRFFFKAKVWTTDVQTVTFTLLRHGFDFRAESKAFELELTFP
jgi:hypothetical protein